MPNLLWKSGLRLTTVLASLLAMAAMPMRAAAEEDRPTIVRIGTIGWEQGGRLVVGGGQSAVLAAKGWLAEDLAKVGVALQWYPVPSAVGGPGFNEALANRTVDFASYGDFPAIIARAGGIDIRLVAPAGRGTNSYLVVPAGSSVSGISELRGKRVSVQRGRPLELAFAKLIQSQGLTHRDFSIFNVSAQSGAAALAAGSIDALFTGSDAYLLVDKGVGRIIWTTKETPWKWRAELFVRGEFADRHPDITQIVVNAYVRAAYWSSLTENRAEVIRITTRSGTPLSVVERDYQGDTTAWKDRWSPLFDDLMFNHYRDAVSFARAQRLIRGDVDVEKWFDERFVREALRSMKLESHWAARTVAVGEAPKDH